MKCWYDGSMELHKGEVVTIMNAHKEKYPYQGCDWRVNVLKVVTTGRLYKSWFSIKPLAEPITGRVVSSEVRDDLSDSTTYFEIEEGTYDNYVFVKPGEVKKGQAALKEILADRTYQYVKIIDPYISADTIKLLSNVDKSITIFILTQKFTDGIDAVKKEANGLPNKITVKIAPYLHDRYILTTGEGWHIGHSLKDFGTKTSQATKLETSLEVETDFDQKWNQSKKVFEKS